MKYSTLGYKENSPDKNEKSLFIPSGKITMEGVSKSLTLIPVVNGKPQFNKKVIAKPGDDDIDFGDVDGVLEIPFAQTGTMLGTLNPSITQFGNLNIPQEKNNNLDFSLPNSPLPKSTFEPTMPNITLTTNGINNYSQYNADTSVKHNVDTTINAELPNISLIDPNATQQQEAKDKPFVGAINPYGGYNLANASTYLGASIANKNPFGIATSGLKVGLGLARNIVSGIGAARRFNQGLQEQEENIKKEYEDKLPTSYNQKGGLLLTGNAIVGNDTSKVSKELELSNFINSVKIIKEEFDHSTNEYIITYE